jgi:hypothetical protein
VTRPGLLGASQLISVGVVIFGTPLTDFEKLYLHQERRINHSGGFMLITRDSSHELICYRSRCPSQ